MSQHGRAVGESGRVQHDGASTHPRATRHLLLLSALTGALTGCMPAHRPIPPGTQVAAPQNWRQDVAGTAQVEAEWWRAFGDPTLTGLVTSALTRNTDILGAIARVEEARALAEEAEAAYLPAVNGVIGVQNGRALAGTRMATTHAVQPGIQLSWEVDPWGRLHQQAQAVTLRLQASQAERDGVALAVTAATAQSYVSLLALDAQLQITRATATSRAEALRLAADQARIGYISQLQLTQAESEFETVRQAIPQLEQAIRLQENALRVLVGEIPGEVARGQRFQQLLLPSVPATLPSELLDRRPDIARSALLLAASDANLAARRIAFLPQVTLSANVGRLFINTLNYSPETLWNLGGSILAPIFSAGRLTAQVDSATAQRDQAAYAYRAVVLGAFAEVENALIGVVRLREQIQHAQKRRDILARSLEHAHDRYQAGYASYLEELDAQRNLYQSEVDLIKLRQSQFNNLIALHRSLGGGWARSM